MSQTKIRNMEAFAAACGISRPTISKYFNNPDSVRQSTRQRIERALEQYDYRPNIFDPVFGELALNCERRCLTAGYRTTLISAHGEQGLEIEAFNRLKALRPAGVLLAPLGRQTNTDALADFCEQVPTVLFDRNMPNVGEAFVGSDNKSFVAQSVEHLLQAGEAPCFFEMKNPLNPNSIARRRSYRSVMKARGLEPMVVQIDGEGWNLEEIGYNGAMRALDKKLFATSTILCSNDRLAFGLLAACHEKGLRVGRHKGCDLRVAGHDDHPFSRFTCPSLTTVGHDYDAVANYGVECLFDLIAQEGHFERRSETIFPARLVVRESA